MMEKIDPKKTAVLIIDMQKAFVEPGAALRIAGAKKTVPAIAYFAGRMRQSGAKVIWVTRSYEADGSNMEIPRRKEYEEKGLLGILAPGTTGINSIEDAEGLEPEEGDLRIVKPRFSAFFGTGLYDILKERGIDTVILTGTTTPNCIRATAYDAISYDLRTIAAEDCCSSMTDEIQKANMEDMSRFGTETENSASILDALR